MLTEIEAKIFGKSHDYAPVQSKIKEPELKQDFEGFYYKMRIKWHFCNGLTAVFSITSAFSPKTTRKQPNDSLKLF